jgi:hypothetical protein
MLTWMGRLGTTALAGGSVRLWAAAEQPPSAAWRDPGACAERLMLWA